MSDERRPAQHVTEGRFWDAYRTGFDDGYAAAADPDSILAAIVNERKRQDAQWGGPEHDDQHSRRDWLRFIDHQLARGRLAVDIGDTGFADDPNGYRERLVKIAALSFAALESFDRKREGQ